MLQSTGTPSNISASHFLLAPQGMRTASSAVLPTETFPWSGHCSPAGNSPFYTLQGHVTAALCYNSDRVPCGGNPLPAALPATHLPSILLHPSSDEDLWNGGPKETPVSRRPRELSLPAVAVQWAQLLGAPVDSFLTFRQKGIYLVLGMPEMTDRVCLLLHEFCKDTEHVRVFLHSSAMHQGTLATTWLMARSSSWQAVLNCFLFLTIFSLAL